MEKESFILGVYAMQRDDESWEDIEKEFREFWTSLPPAQEEKKVINYWQVFWKWIKDFLEYMGSFI